MKALREIYRIVNNYGISRLLGTPSTAGFWYTPDRATVFDHNTLQTYLESSVPFYLIDYRPKLGFGLVNRDGIIVLPYDQPVGPQINPEAAFQYALGLHDEYLATGDRTYLKRFLHYAEYFYERQHPTGDWYYEFDWDKSIAPWGSALAQSRGASVMLRAGMHSKDARFTDSARLALSKFFVPGSEGGYLFTREFGGHEVSYFEEYPKHPTAVLNGFMAALFGTYEIGVWLGDEPVKELWRKGIEALKIMLPSYTATWWTLYDIGYKPSRTNYNSPHYHTLTVTYQRVLAALCGEPRDEVMHRFLTLWEAQDKGINALRGTYHKLVFRVIG